jgi:hypothetical protein
MSFFQKSKIELEKTLHHHFFGVRLRHFRDLTFMLLFLFGGVVTCRPLCCGFANRRKNTKKGRECWQSGLREFLDGRFRGCFGKMSKSIFRIFQKMTQKLAKRFARILGWPFSGDVLEKCPNRFGEMEQHRLPQTDGRESWEVVLGNS